MIFRNKYSALFNYSWNFIFSFFRIKWRSPFKPLLFVPFPMLISSNNTKNSPYNNNGVVQYATNLVLSYFSDGLSQQKILLFSHFNPNLYLRNNSCNLFFRSVLQRRAPTKSSSKETVRWGNCGHYSLFEFSACLYFRWWFK